MERPKIERHHFMRIAYIAPYHGPDLLKRRPIVHNRSLAATSKIEVTARLFLEKSHSVEVISQGEVVRSGSHFYPAFVETQRFHPEIPVYYLSALTIRFIRGWWEEMQALRLFKARHKAAPFDAVIIYNTKRAQLACANYARDRLGLPVLLSYEDDAFTNFTGEKANGILGAYNRWICQRVLNKLSGCYAVSPHLLSHVPDGVPKLLLRGVVDPAIVNTSQNMKSPKKNWVSFAGTHTKANGVGPLIDAWISMKLPEWELHIAGQGEDTAALQEKAAGRRDIVFHGVLRGQALADFLCSSKICISPTEVSRTPGNVFPSKIVDYLASGAHAIATPAGALEKEIENGLTYMPSNDSAVIATTIQQVIQERRWERNVAPLVCDKYGPAAVAGAIDALLQRARSERGQRPLAALPLAGGALKGENSVNQIT
jgi:glycosyltransferase involved in cell wall biosynthesis